MYAQPLIVPETDQQRVYDTWRLRMMLDGTWRTLLAEHGQRQLGPLRSSLVGEWDTSANLFSSVIDQTSTMYDEQPEELSPDRRSLEVLRDSFERGGWWAMARTHQRYVRGLRESAVVVGWDSAMGRPTYDLVTPDFLTVEAAVDNRSRPVTIWRARERRGCWVWDRWSIAGGYGSLTVWSADRQRNMTAAFMNPSEWAGDAYPYRDDEGRPILPIVLYHSVGCGAGLWHPHQHQEVAFGTLQVGVLWTAMIHGFLRASWDQRWIANGRVRGGAVQTAGNQSVRLITPDPTAILELDSTAGGTATAGAWGASIDILAAEQTVRRYENRLGVHFGLSPADLVIESLNPASGASITVSRDGKRVIAARDLVHFRRGDRELAEVTASVNRGWGRPCSAEGYRLRYHGIELSAAEREVVNRYLTAELQAGLADRVTAYQELHPGVDVEDAMADLAVIDARKAFEARRAAVIAQLNAPAPGLAAAA